MVVEVKKRRKVQVVVHLNTWCSDGYGSVGEHEMRSDRGRERVRQEGDRIGRIDWMVKSLRRYVGWEDCMEL